jgi:FMN phosphatase YigB (HAD superfamily)
MVLGFRYGFEKGKDHFDYVMKKCGLNREELIFVGDSLKDAEKAITNGVRFIGLCGIFSKEDFQKVESDLQTITSIKELKEICGQ